MFAWNCSFFFFFYKISFSFGINHVCKYPSWRPAVLKAMKYISCKYTIKMYENKEWNKSMFSSVFNLFCFPWKLTLFICFAYILRLNLYLRHYSKPFNIFCFSLTTTIPITFSSLINVFFFLSYTFLQKFFFNKLSTILLFLWDVFPQAVRDHGSPQYLFCLARNKLYLFINF